MTSDISVFGAGGHAKVVIDAWRAAGGSVAAIWDDDPAIIGTHVMGVRVIGSLDDMADKRGPIMPVIGNNRARFSQYR